MSIDEKTAVRAPAAASAHSVLVVIPCLNEARTLEGVLRELGAGLPANAEVQFVVADGCSSDGTVELAQRLAAQSPAANAMKRNPAAAALEKGCRGSEWLTPLLMSCSTDRPIG